MWGYKGCRPTDILTLLVEITSHSFKVVLKFSYLVITDTVLLSWIQQFYLPHLRITFDMNKLFFLPFIIMSNTNLMACIKYLISTKYFSSDTKGM
jgi:hypothetical protein